MAGSFDFWRESWAATFGKDSNREVSSYQNVDNI